MELYVVIKHGSNVNYIADICLTEDIANYIVDQLTTIEEDLNDKDKYRLDGWTYWIEKYNLNMGNYTIEVTTNK